ncbi:heterokaryon incompatibility protein-domain-containing protein [Paraphoma chrysanthemicola]|nr:heterokaryon incompatibility protein-domain-containing protein [Paraphoma chrysanthemicola]
MTLRKASNIYKYTRIPHDRVRLLLLKPGLFDDDIYVSLITVRDDQLGTEDFEYCALSYHWGGGDFSNTVFVQEDATAQTLRTLENVVNAKRPKKLSIKPNLCEALKHLRHKKEVVSIWIDALCINQFDEDEKNEQVRKMPLIYSRAYNVNVWLGSDESENPVSDLAMSFIPKVINLDLEDALLRDDAYVKSWASLFELLKWSWFSRRWVIQELALAQTATVHCGKHICLWNEFQTAIAIFRRNFDTLKPKLARYFESTQPDRDIWGDDSVLNINHLGATLLVDMTINLFQRNGNGPRQSKKGLEDLVCSLSGFDTSDPRDTINAFRSISRELNYPDSIIAQGVPAPDYGKDLFEVYRDFVKWVITTTQSLDILCRFWALKERKTLGPTTPRLVELPSWIQYVEDGAWGKAEDTFNGRRAGDSFVGLPGDHNYCASGQGGTYKHPVFDFPTSPIQIEQTGSTGMPVSSFVKHDTSLLVRGVAIGTVTFRTDAMEGVIIRECLRRLGWSFDRSARTVPDVPDQLWKTLVADRDPDGNPTPPEYKIACQHVLKRRSNNGQINIDDILRRMRNKHSNSQPSIVQAYLERVKAVTFNRSFIEGTVPEGDDKLVGFAPDKTEAGDIIVIMFGCSTPVILRRTYNSSLTEPDEYQFVGEAYIHGKMGGEAFDEEFHSQDFRLV